MEGRRNGTVHNREAHQADTHLAVVGFSIFPFDRNKNYPDIERYSMMETVLRYLVDFTYKRRNATECLGITHRFDVRENCVTIKTINNVPYLTIHLITEE